MTVWMKPDGDIVGMEAVISFDKIFIIFEDSKGITLKAYWGGLWELTRDWSKLGNL